MRIVLQAAAGKRYRLDQQTHQASQMMEGDVIDGTGLEIIGCWALFGRFSQRPGDEAIGWNSSSFDENAVLR